MACVWICAVGIHLCGQQEQLPALNRKPISTSLFKAIYFAEASHSFKCSGIVYEGFGEDMCPGMDIGCVITIHYAGHREEPPECVLLHAHRDGRDRISLLYGVARWCSGMWFI